MTMLRRCRNRLPYVMVNEDILISSELHLAIFSFPCLFMSWSLRRQAIKSHVTDHEQQVINLIYITLTLTAYFNTNHDDVIKWKHFPRYWPFAPRGIHRSPVNSPHKGQWRGALMLSLIFALNKRLSKQSWGWWFETPSGSLWRHCDNFPFIFSETERVS